MSTGVSRIGSVTYIEEGSCDVSVLSDFEGTRLASVTTASSAGDGPSQPINSVTTAIGALRTKVALFGFESACCQEPELNQPEGEHVKAGVIQNLIALR